jgi:pilus assembly protein CpaE
MPSSTFKRIHVLVLQGELVAATDRVDQATSTEDLLHSEPALKVTIKSASLGQAGPLAKAIRPDVILIDGMRGDPVDVLTELDEALRDTPVLVLLDEVDYDRVHAVVVAGARGCLVRPFDADALTATIVQVHNKASRRRQLHPDLTVGTAATGQLIAVRGTKGGVGATAVAINVAVALKRRTKQSTVVVDGHFFGGDVPVALNLAPNRSIVD